jgi:hypothetical protein
VERTTLPSIVRRLGASLLALAFHGMATAQPDLDAIHPILRSIFDASGLNEGERRAFEIRFDALARDVAARIGNVRSPERRARRLHRVLHDRVFVRYRDDADGIDDVIARGEFNCVSSTLVEGLLASSLGLRPTIASSSRHVFLRLELPSRVVDVETTYRDGFDARGSAAASERFLLADRAVNPDATALRGLREQDESPGAAAPSVPLAFGAAFVWYNAAERALARGEGRSAAEYLSAGETLYPGVASGGASLQAQLGRAFRLDYDAARFDDAYVSAAIGVRLGPTVVSAHDRLIAAAAQRLEALLDRGNLEQAEQVLVDLRGMLGDGANRFERHMLPLVVAAAVRVGDWDRADCLSERFGTVELDEVEARRLRAWVSGRHGEALK